MNLLTNGYFFILIAVVLFYYITPLKYRYIVLLLASVGFYVFFSKVLTLFLCFTTISIYITAIIFLKNNNKAIDVKNLGDASQTKLAKKRAAFLNKLAATIVILLNIGFLVFLKYFNFLSNIINPIFKISGLTFRLPLLKLILPLGISYYTLSAIGYLIDVYRSKIIAEKNFLRLMLFLWFFPTIIEGPICRYEQTGAQLFNGNKFSYQNTLFAIQRILWGIFKKMVVADRIYLIVKTVFLNSAQFSGYASVIGILAYTIMLYAEFSGAMDMVIGSAELFGVKLPENFARPYFSKSVQEFWRRWHITLGAWLKDYVFYSVALSPKLNKFFSKIKKRHKNLFTKMLPTFTALFVLWVCNGLWHGPAWKYIFYGLYYFALIFLGIMTQPLFDKLHKKLKINTDSKIYSTFQIIRTFTIVNIGMLIFGSTNLSAAFKTFASVFTSYSGGIASLGISLADTIVLVFGIATMLTVSIVQEKGIDIRQCLAAKPTVLRWGVYQALIIAIIVFGAYGGIYQAVPFIYADF